METLIKLIELIFTGPLKKYFKTVFCYLKEKWQTYWMLAVLIILTYAAGFVIAIYEPFKIRVINEKPNKVNAVAEIHGLIDEQVALAGHGVTYMWITVTTPNLNSYKRNLNFAFVKSCNFNIDPQDCLVDSKLVHPEYYLPFDISERDGRFLEEDKIVFFDENNPIIFKELISVVIPVYQDGKLSIEMTALKYKAPKIYQKLQKNPVTLNSMQNIILNKIRDNNIVNKRVIHLILITQWSMREGSQLSLDGLKNSAALIAKTIKDNMLLISI